MIPRLHQVCGEPKHCRPFYTSRRPRYDGCARGIKTTRLNVHLIEKGPERLRSKGGGELPGGLQGASRGA